MWEVIRSLGGREWRHAFGPYRYSDQRVDAARRPTACLVAGIARIVPTRPSGEAVNGTDI
jgi:hypothetical protein